MATDPAQPRDGDVVVGRASGNGGAYTIRQFPGDAQLQSSVRNDAIRLAHDFAVNAGVDVWYVDERSHTLLEAHRKRST
jgi:hypothetical protein